MSCEWQTRARGCPSGGHRAEQSTAQPSRVVVRQVIRREHGGGGMRVQSSSRLASLSFLLLAASFASSAPPRARPLLAARVLCDPRTITRRLVCAAARISDALSSGEQRAHARNSAADHCAVLPPFTPSFPSLSLALPRARRPPAACVVAAALSAPAPLRLRLRRRGLPQPLLVRRLLRSAHLCLRPALCTPLLLALALRHRLATRRSGARRTAERESRLQGPRGTAARPKGRASTETGQKLTRPLDPGDSRHDSSQRNTTRAQAATS